jgi:hypothetical protein
MDRAGIFTLALSGESQREDILNLVNKQQIC